MGVKEKLSQSECNLVPGQTISKSYLVSGHLLLVFDDNTWFCGTNNISGLMEIYREHGLKCNPFVDSNILDWSEVDQYWQEYEQFRQQADRTSAIQLYRVAVSKLDELGITKEEAELE